MNSNLAKVGKPTRWAPGQSGNPAGKPPGTRTAFSQGFIRDFALVWAEEGLEAVRKVAKKSPEAFVAIAARICPNDVAISQSRRHPKRFIRRRHSAASEKRTGITARALAAACPGHAGDALGLLPCGVPRILLAAPKALSFLRRQMAVWARARYDRIARHAAAARPSLPALGKSS